MTQYFISRDKGDYHDMVGFLGKMRGATRISVGIGTTEEDLQTLLDFVKSSFDAVSA